MKEKIFEIYYKQINRELKPIEDSEKKLIYLNKVILKLRNILIDLEFIKWEWTSEGTIKWYPCKSKFLKKVLSYTGLKVVNDENLIGEDDTVVKYTLTEVKEELVGLLRKINKGSSQSLY